MDLLCRTFQIGCPKSDLHTEETVARIESVGENADRLLRQAIGNDLADTLDRVPVPFLDPNPHHPAGEPHDWS